MGRGLHGKNAELRISVSETAYSDVPLSALSGRIYQAASNRRNWKYGHDLLSVVIDFGGGITEEIDPQSPYIHYGGGAVYIPPHISLGAISGVNADAVVMDLAGVSAKPSCTRQFDVATETEILDSTCMGDSFKSKVTGIPDWNGTLQGLYIDSLMWGLAVAGVSGIVPEKILRFRPDPLHEDTYFQGTVLFPRHEMSAGFDALIEQNIDFEGNGPLQLVRAGVPIFPNLP